MFAFKSTKSIGEYTTSEDDFERVRTLWIWMCMRDLKWWSIYSSLFSFLFTLFRLYRYWSLFEKTWHVSNILINSAQTIHRGASDVHICILYNDDSECVWHRHSHRCVYVSIVALGYQVL